MIPISLLVIVIIAAFNISFIVYEINGQNRHSDQMFSEAYNQFITNKEFVGEQLHTFSSNLLKDEMIDAQFIKNATREEIVERYTTLFQRMISNKDISHFYFHSTSGVNIVRLHKPDIFGDTIHRASMEEAMANESSSTILEMGPLGTLTLRNVSPIFDSDTIVAYIELGIEIETLFRGFNFDNLTSITILLQKDILTQENWEIGMEMLGRTYDWDLLKEHIILFSSKENPTVDFPVLERHENLHRSVHRIHLPDGSIYSTTMYPLNDHRGNYIGDYSFALDITEDSSQFTSLIKRLTLISLLISIITLIFIYNLLKSSDRKIAAQQKGIKENEYFFKESQQAALIGSYQSEFYPNDFWKTSEMFDKIFGIDESYNRTVQGWIDLLHPDFAEEMTRYVTEDVIGRGIPFNKEYKIIRHNDGKTRWVLGLGETIEDETGRTTGLIGTIQDITERKQAEMEVNQTRAQYQSLVENIPGIVYRCKFDKDWTMLYISDVVDPLSGYPSSDFINNAVRTYESVIHPDDTDFVAVSVNTAVIDRQPWGIEYRIRCKNGDIRWVYEKGRGVLCGEDGSVAYLEGFILDITERKQAEDKLEKSQKDYQRLVDKSPYILYRYSLSTGARFWSSCVKDILGFTQKHLKEVPFIWNQSIHPDDKELVDKALQNIVDGIPDEVVEYRIKDTKGNWHNFSDRFFDIVKDDDDTIVEGIAMDITDKIELEDQLRQSEKMQAVGQLAGGIAHDFNNQLAAIAGYADLLREEADHEPELEQYVAGILSGVKRSSDLTSQLLAFSRKGKKQITSVDIHSTISEVVKMLERTIDKGISISVNLNAASHFVAGDPTQLQNALLNLGINARDAQPDGGEILFLTEVVEVKKRDNSYGNIEEGAYLKIAVSDKGIGIPAKDKARIFEPFFTTKELGKGTGMGLAAVYGTITNHGGSVHIDTKVNRGTTFTIYLPISKVETLLEEAEPHTESIEGVETVLLVEDEEFVRSVCKTMLEKLGYSVSTCNDGIGALDFYKEKGEEIDLVILDLMMPIMGGKQTFIQLKKMNPEIKVILSSGYSLDGEVQELIDSGVKGFIQKPYIKSELSKVVHDALNKVI